ncbi:MAG: hypothetical protein OXE99_06160 [Cellvibrionales bacterium]|nr:hypothetical protein [Cellvibrionales bacterium]
MKKLLLPLIITGALSLQPTAEAKIKIGAITFCIVAVALFAGGVVYGVKRPDKSKEHFERGVNLLSGIKKNITQKES